MASVLRPFTLTRGNRLKLALASLAFVLIGGTAGLILIEGLSPLDAIYMVVITLSTVGYGEVQPLHPVGKIFVMLIIAFGVITVGLFATIMGEMLLEGQVKELVARRRMDKTISQLEGHSIIAGFGRVGRQVAMEFVKRGIQFVVLERYPEASQRLRDLGYTFVEGDATREETLRACKIQTAKTLISTLPEESQNVYLTLTARYLNPNLFIISRADYEEGEKKLILAGANHVVVPHILGGTRMAMASIQPNVVDFMQMTGSTTGLVLEEIKVPEKCFLVDKTLSDSQIKTGYGITVIGIKKTGQDLLLNPESNTTIEAGDILVIIGQGTDLDKFSRDLHT